LPERAKWCIITPYSFSPASTVMRHAREGFGVLDGTRVGNENLKKLLD
jgi:hypothetical protein